MTVTHEEFVALLPENQRQFSSELIQELSKIPEISVYHTDANGGDFRVRIGDEGRVLFTMYWQSRNEAYFCRCFVETQYLAAQEGLFEISLEPDYQPQISSFKFKPNYVNTISVLTSLVKETVKRYHFLIQKKSTQ
jgi:hypothetical protein